MTVGCRTEALLAAAYDGDETARRVLLELLPPELAAAPANRRRLAKRAGLDHAADWLRGLMPGIAFSTVTEIIAAAGRAVVTSGALDALPELAELSPPERDELARRLRFVVALHAPRAYRSRRCPWLSARGLRRILIPWT